VYELFPDSEPNIAGFLPVASGVTSLGSTLSNDQAATMSSDFAVVGVTLQGASQTFDVSKKS
jgi:hypothetical protein